MGGERESASPQIPKEVRDFITLAKRITNQAYSDLRAGRGFLSEDELRVDPTRNELAASDYAYRISRDPMFKDRLNEILMGTGEGDVDAAYRAVEARERERLGADIKETVGGRVGSIIGSALPREISSAFTDLAERGVVNRIGVRERSLDRSLNAGQVLTGYDAMIANMLMGTGQNIRGIEESNIARIAEQGRARYYGVPIQLASTASGAASSAPMYQPTYGPGRTAGLLAGAATGASIAGAAGMSFTAANPAGWAVVGAGALLGMLG